MNETLGNAIQQQKRIAVIYLLQNKEEIPEGLEKFFDKLIQYESSMKEIVAAGQQTERTLQELNSKREQLTGSINSVVDMIVEDLPEDKSMEWAQKANIPGIDQSVVSSNNPATPVDVDMAGSTAKQVPVGQE